MNKTIFLAIIISFIYYPVISQNYQFRHIEVEDGLPSSEVYHVFQDAEGYIWFATNMGVSKYDGYNFENFDLEDGLPDNTIFDIYQDSRSRIWFVSFSLKLSYYHNGKIHPYQFNEEIQNYLQGSFVNNKKSFAVDSLDNLYIGINELGVIKIDSTGNVSREPKDDSIENLFILNTKERPITALKNYQYDAIKLKNKNGIFKLNYKRTINKWQNNVFVEKYNQDDLLMAFEGQLIHFDNKAIKQKIDLNTRITWMSSDKNNLWLGTYKGLMRYSKNKLEEPEEIILSKYPISSILRDHENGCWFTSLTRGVFYAPTLAFKTINTDDGLTSEVINQITHDKEKNLWISDEHNNIIHLSPNHQILKSFSTPKSIKPRKINTLDYNPFTDEVWVSNGFSIKNGRMQKDKEPYKAIFFKSEEVAYAAGSMGVFYFKNKQTAYQSWRHNPVYRLNSIIDTKYGEYAGGLRGLFKHENKKLTLLDSIDKRFNYRITDILKYEDYLLLGTRGAGILIYNPAKGSVNQINRNDNLISNNIKRILSHKNILYVATNNGLSKIEIHNVEKKYFNIANFSTYSGLPGSEINDIEIINDRLYVATNKGLAYSRLNQMSINSTPPKIHIRKITISGKDTTLLGSYNLPHDENFIQIQYTGLSYKNAGNLRYRYKMEGIDDEWKFTTNTEKMYTTLPPGKYTFKVLVENENGIWSKKTASTQFIIQKPYWRTLWFILLVSALGVTILYLIFHFRFRLVKRKNQLIQDINNYKQIVLRQQMNPHFLFNTLNSIQYYLLDNDTHSSLSYLSKFARLMRTILENSQHTYISLNAEINALKLYLELEQIRMDNNFEYHFEIAEGIDPEENIIPSMLLQPYVENSIHHGLRYKQNGKGIINIKVKPEDDMIVYTITDNGIGRPRAQEIKEKNQTENKPLGSKITENRIKTLNALMHKKISINYEDIIITEGTITGTKVEIKIPIDINQSKK